MKYHQSISSTRWLLVGLLALSFIAITFRPTSAPAATETPTISTIVNSEAIEWQVEPQNAYERLILVVIGPDKTAFRLAYEANDLPFLGLNSLISSGLPDGFYKYELTLVPTLTPEAREFISLAREGDNSDLLTEAQEAGLLPKEGSVLAGSFTINEGLFVLPETSETSLRSDQVIADDLIVQFSACIGNDCINGEAFDFDTLRLKENNLRIHFDDTSGAAGFPANDWRIVINDSSNGGGNYFAIEDATAARQLFKVEAGAPSNSLYVDDGGRIGLGTSTPAVELHIVDGDSPALRLEQDGSSGFTPQTWDVAGNETNFFIRDTTGSTLPLRIRPGAPTGAIDIQASGEVQFVQSIVVGSSRDIKQNIKDLSSEDAFKTLQKLTPVTYQYKVDKGENHVGFIAEDVPEMVAVNGRKGLSSMDFVAVLTKIVQEQQLVIGNQNRALEKMEKRLKSLEYEVTESSRQDW